MAGCVIALAHPEADHRCAVVAGDPGLPLALCERSCRTNDVFSTVAVSLGIRGSAPIGIALKIEDGSGRASAAVMLEVLAQLDLISQAKLDKLSKYRKPVFKNHAGIETGFINVNFKLYF